MKKQKTIKTISNPIKIDYIEISFACQGFGFDVKTLYQNMLCMCGGHYNSFFSQLEKRRIDEVLYLFFNWQKIHDKQDKPDINLDDQIYEPLG